MLVRFSLLALAVGRVAAGSGASTTCAELPGEFTGAGISGEVNCTCEPNNFSCTLDNVCATDAVSCNACETAEDVLKSVGITGCECTDLSITCPFAVAPPTCDDYLAYAASISNLDEAVDCFCEPNNFYCQVSEACASDAVNCDACALAMEAFSAVATGCSCVDEKITCTVTAAADDSSTSGASSIGANLVGGAIILGSMVFAG